MDTTHIAHPSDAVIAAFLQGKLSPDEAARWEGHLADCPHCVQKMAAVGADTYSELLRAGPLDTPPLAAVGRSGKIAGLPAELEQHERYEVVRLLGAGGMGMVFQALHRIMNRPVALKVIRPDLLATPLAVSRFRREVQVVARLVHPNIVTAYDAEEIAGVHFLVMEYIDGRSLDRLVAQKGPLAVPLACALARQVAQGLDHAHSQGMIHRDIKPQNLMVTRSGKVKILDFGLSCVIAGNVAGTPRLTYTDTALGTLLYAAPEQMRSAEQADGRADLYSLGVTLVHLLTGQPPSLDASVSSSDRTKMEGGRGNAVGAIRLAQLPADVPEGVRAILRCLLAEDPADRYPTARAVSDALAPWCVQRSAEAVEAAPVRAAPVRADTSPGRRLWPLLAGAAGVVLLAGLVLGGMLYRGGESPAPVANPSGENSERTLPAVAGATTLPVVFVLPSEGLWYEDYGPVRDALVEAGVKVRVATPGGVASRLHENSLRGSADRPMSVAADLALDQVHAEDLSAVVFVGFEVREFVDPQSESRARVQQLLQRCQQGERWLVGICYGQWVLGRAGVLRERAVAQPTELVGDLGSTGARPRSEQTVVVDGRLITASGPSDAGAAGRVLAESLRGR